MRLVTILLWMSVVAILAFGTAGCEEDEVKVHKSYEGAAPPPEQPADEGETVYRRSVTMEDEGFDDVDDEEDEVKIQRSGETTTETQEMLIEP